MVILHRKRVVCSRRDRWT